MKKCVAERRLFAWFSPWDIVEYLPVLTDLSSINVNVDAAVIASLKSLFGEAKTVETVAAYKVVSRFLVALDI
ncbi:hypothetical protein TMSI_26480 [Klebsiella quasipneumoniae]|nr:hypothetical protein TMSI_26480 [Klebsiella quasipneumoniae]GKP92503.1 hypothetical protein NUKP71_31850 [Klebsiella quasipneumoniae]